MDIGGKLNDPVYAAADGTVAARGWDASRGYYVRIRHDDETQTVYMHLGKIAVKVNEDVKKGEKIASMGSTGRSTGPHLHFEIWKNGQPVNPVEYVGDRHP